MSGMIMMTNLSIYLRDLCRPGLAQFPYPAWPNTNIEAAAVTRQLQSSKQTLPSMEQCSQFIGFPSNLTSSVVRYECFAVQWESIKCLGVAGGRNLENK